MELTNKNIAGAVEKIRAFFEEAGVPRKDVLKICLVAEEALLRYQEKFGTAHEFTLSTKKFLSAPKIIIRIKGEPFYPLENEPDDDSIFSNEVMRRLLHYEEAETIYRYENGCNEIISSSTKERKPRKIPGGAITVAILLAIIFSFAFNALSPDVQKILPEQIAEPTLSALLKLIVTVTIFMMFTSIVAGISAIEDSTMLGNIGATVLGRFFVIDVCIVALTIFAGQIFFQTEIISADDGKFDASEIVSLLLAIVPTNILEAFLQGNALQVTVLAFLVGICITNLGGRIPNVKIFVNELNALVFKILQTVFKVIPLIIFLCVFKTLATSSFADFLKVWQLVVAELVVYATLILSMLIFLALKTKTQPADFLRKIFPAFLVAFTTGSSSVALPQSLEVSKENLRVDEKLCNFWIPLALVLFSPSKLIQLTMAGFYVSVAAGDGISITELLIISFLAIQLSFASPNAAGGIAAAFSILLTQLELPMEFIGALMIADVLTGNLFTALNILVRESEPVFVAHKMNFIKRD